MIEDYDDPDGFDPLLWLEMTEQNAWDGIGTCYHVTAGGSLQYCNHYPFVLDESSMLARDYLLESVWNRRSASLQ